MADDPDHLARNRFVMMGMTRIAGVATVLLGLLTVTDNLGWPAWVGWILIAFGLAEVFFAPQMMARRWRTPPEDEAE